MAAAVNESTVPKRHQKSLWAREHAHWMLNSQPFIMNVMRCSLWLYNAGQQAEANWYFMKVIFAFYDLIVSRLAAGLRIRVLVTLRRQGGDSLRHYFKTSTQCHTYPAVGGRSTFSWQLYWDNSVFEQSAYCASNFLLLTSSLLINVAF